MADCYFHGQGSPGSCPECIEEGRIEVFRGGYRVTAFGAGQTGALNRDLQDPKSQRAILRSTRKK
ncbi:MAG: hypothetical protein KBD06_04235 [Candidatus Pacebacteria bacterium]|nr:hypothetical protein [Candidatus Paceibacterota bacterium]